MLLWRLMMRQAALFVLMCIAGGLGGAVGSILGNAVGRRGLFAGGVLGGVLAVLLAAVLARRFRWIRREALWTTAVGGVLGFLTAAFIATRTLSSPVGPALSTLLVGTGAILGARLGSPRATDGEAAA
jgi:hypothetical protein